MNHQTKFKQTEIGIIPEVWEVVELKDILEDKGYIRGPFGSALRRPELKSEGIPVYEQENAIYNNREFRYFLDNEKFLKLSRFAVEENDLIISCSGTFGKVSIIRKEDPKGIISQALLILRPNTNKINALYLKYFFTSDQGFNSIASRSLGSVQINIAKRGIIERIELPLPPLTEQRAIAKILSDLDAKIELNSQINKNLEQIVQVIFKRWFIDFEFPNENGEPYKSSGGKMMDSEMGLIPKGWKFEKLGNLLSEIITGNRPKGGVSKFKKGIPSIGAESINGLCNFDFSKTKYIPESYFSNMIKGIVKNGDILLYKDGANLGRKSMFLENFPFKRCCINSHVFILRSNSLMKQSYLYFYLDQKFMTKNIINLNTNSAQPGINSTSVKTLKILLPSDKILNLFNELVFSILKKIFNDSKGNQCLSNLRDTLLPKLMSGEIRVPINNKNYNQLK